MNLATLHAARLWDELCAIDDRRVEAAMNASPQERYDEITRLGRYIPELRQFAHDGVTYEWSIEMWDQIREPDRYFEELNRAALAKPIPPYEYPESSAKGAL